MRDDTQQENKIGYSGKIRSIASLQEPSPAVIESDVNTPDQQPIIEDHNNSNKFISSPEDPATFIEMHVVKYLPPCLLIFKPLLLRTVGMTGQK